MEAKQEKFDEHDYSENDTGVRVEEKNLIVLKGKARKNFDDTISTPDKYVSRYHYGSQNIDKYMEYCPHCKKPLLTSFRRAVIDSAVDYLEGKRVLIDYSSRPRSFMTYITCLMAIVTGAYFLLFHVVSGFKI